MSFYCFKTLVTVLFFPIQGLTFKLILFFLYQYCCNKYLLFEIIKLKKNKGGIHIFFTFQLFNVILYPQWGCRIWQCL